jgi:glycosyltransferase involved in cell wall biosynthesis
VTDDARYLLGIDPARIHCVGAAADARFVPTDSPARAAEEVLQALMPFGLLGRYVFAPSGSHPRKNNELLVAAFATLPAALRARLQLVVQGELDEPTRHHYAVLAERLGAQGAVVTPGRVEDSLLVRLYQGAELVCVPSLAEGFGLPIAEALACSTPVICADRPPFDELVAPEGRFDPTSGTALAGALITALTDDALRTRLRRPVRPLDDWNDVAAKTAATFRAMLPPRGTPRPRPLRRRRPRVAFVTPLPPAASGVAGYSSSIIRALLATEKVELDLYRDGPTADQRAPYGLDVRDPGSLTGVEALLGRYDHVVYCLGNSHHHLGALAMLRRRPGTVLAHDVRLSNLYRAEHGDPGYAPGGFERELRRQYGDLLPSGLGHDAELSRTDLDLFGVLMAREAVACAERFLVTSDVAATLARSDVGPALAPRVAVLPFAVGRPGDGEFAEQARTLPDGVDERVGRYWGRAADLDGRHAVVAHFGIVDPVKLPDLTIEAFSMVARHDADAELVFVGPIADDLLRSLARQAVAGDVADRIAFTGPLAREDYAGWFAAATVAMQLRSNTNGEASAAVGECLASGVPTIVTRLGWAAGLPDDAVHKVDARCSAHELAHELRLLVGDRGRRVALGRAANRYAEEHGFERTARALIAELARVSRELAHG